MIDSGAKNIGMRDRNCSPAAIYIKSEKIVPAIHLSANLK
jgi:hypothetical protein